MNGRTATVAFPLFIGVSCISAPARADVRVELDSSRLYVEDVLITPGIANRVASALYRHKSIDTVRFVNITGGIVGADEQLRGLISNYSVEVKGACFSSCAMLALYGKQLRLLKEDHPNGPTALLIHGTYDYVKKQWSRHGLSYIPFLHQRLKAITDNDLQTALSYPKPGLNGLLIFRSPWRQMKNNSVVFLCSSFPANCEAREKVTHSMLNITIE